MVAGVGSTAFGFCDQAAFQAQEQLDGTYVEDYADWVATWPIDAAYETHVRTTAPKLAARVAAALIADNMQDGCLTAISMLTRQLDRLGVWSFDVIDSAKELKTCVVDVRQA